MKFFKKITICILFTFSIVFISFICNKDKVITIGTFSSNTAEMEMYLNNNINGFRVKIINLSNLLNDDPFEKSVEIINDVLKKSKVDMLINIEPDYLLCQNDVSIFMNLKEHNLNTTTLVNNYINMINRDSEIYFLPSSVNNTRFLFVNKELMQTLGVDIDLDNLKLEELSQVLEKFDKKLNKDNGDIYAISFGSPIDEYFFDDVEKLLLHLVYPKLQSKKYAECYVEMAKIAKKYSYTRDDIGHSYPMDSYYTSGNVILKIITLYELLEFRHNINIKNSKIDDFDYLILPLPTLLSDKHFNSSEIMLTCISKNTKNKKECLELIDFIYSPTNALKTIDCQNPITKNIASVPLNNDIMIFKEFKKKYGIDNPMYGDSFFVKYFIKNRDKHWNIVKLKREILLDYFQDKLSEKQLYQNIKSIMEDNYDR